MSELEDKPRAQLERFLDNGEALLFARSIWGEWADLRLDDPLVALAPSLYVVGVTSERVIAATQRAMGRPKKLKLDLPRDQVVVIPARISKLRGRGYVGDQVGLFIPLDGEGAGDHERALFLKTTQWPVREGAEEEMRVAVDELTQLLSDRIESSEPARELPLPPPERSLSTSIEDEPTSRLAGFLAPDEELVYARTISANKGLRTPGGPLLRGAPKSLAVGLSDRRLMAAPLGRLQRGGLVVDRLRGEVSLTRERVKFGSAGEGEGFVLGTGQVPAPPR